MTLVQRAADQILDAMDAEATVPASVRQVWRDALIECKGLVAAVEALEHIATVYNNSGTDDGGLAAAALAALTGGMTP